jgi:lambda repressor-like predicted transcriptional regulator
LLLLPTFRDARERSIWVQAQLRLSGSSFAEIARQHGWSRQAVGQAMNAPSEPQERAIADALGVDQRALFPERFNARTGDRLHPVRESIARRDRPGNVKHDEAA